MSNNPNPLPNGFEFNIPEGVDPDEFVNGLLEKAENAVKNVFDPHIKPIDPRNTLKVKPTAVFDLDNTLRRTKSGKPFPNGVDDIELFPDVEAKLWELRDSGYLIQVVSNQGGVAYGFRTPEQIEAETVVTENLFTDNPIHELIVCHAHPHGTVFPYNHMSLLRKPSYGMLVMLETHAREHGFILDWPNSIVVGDRHEDRDMAKAAGVPFKWAWEFFGREYPTDDQWNEALGLKFGETVGGNDRPLCPSCRENSLVTRSTRLASQFPTFQEGMQAHIDDGMICGTCGYIIPRRPLPPEPPAAE